MLCIDNLTVSYRQHPALHHIQAHLPSGQRIAVVGPNGSGKSTLLKAIADLIRPSGGCVRLPVPRSALAYLPQAAEMDRQFPLSVWDLVLQGAWPSLGSWRRPDASWQARAHSALTTVGLGGFERRPIATLSGGQFQRALFARVLVQDARLILLDEPFAALDARTTDALLGVVDAWAAQGRTVLAVLHDMTQVQAHFDHAVLLARELVASGPVAQALSPAHWARAQALAEAWDEHADYCASDNLPHHAHAHETPAEHLEA